MTTGLPAELHRLSRERLEPSDEEIGSPEGGPLLEEAIRSAACALTFEAGRAGAAIITARKGTGGIRVVAAQAQARPRSLATCRG